MRPPLRRHEKEYPPTSSASPLKPVPSACASRTTTDRFDPNRRLPLLPRGFLRYPRVVAMLGTFHDELAHTPGRTEGGRKATRQAIVGLLTVVGMLADSACGGTYAAPTSRSDERGPAPVRSSVRPVPDPAHLDALRPCERKLAQFRLCLSRGRQQSGTTSCSLPETDSGTSTQMSAMTVDVMGDLRRDWNDDLRCGMVLTSSMTEEKLEVLHELGLRPSSHTNNTIWGLIPLRRLLCVMELPEVTRLDCEEPPPVLQ